MNNESFLDAAKADPLTTLPVYVALLAAIRGNQWLDVLTIVEEMGGPETALIVTLSLTAGILSGIAANAGMAPEQLLQRISLYQPKS